MNNSFHLSLLSVALLSLVGLSQDLRIAVLEFQNNSGIQEVEHLKMGIRDMLTTDIQQVSAISLVERARLDEVRKEIDMEQTKYFDAQQTVELGKLLGATHILTGAYLIDKNTMRIDVRLVDVSTGMIVYTDKVNGTTEDFFDLEKLLASKIVEKMYPEVSSKELRRVNQIQTEEFANFDIYSKAVYEEEQGNLDEAIKLLQGVVSEENFKMAREKLALYQQMLEEEIGKMIVAAEKQDSTIVGQKTILENRLLQKDYSAEYFVAKILFAFYSDIVDEGDEYSCRLAGGGEGGQAQASRRLYNASRMSYDIEDILDLAKKEDIENHAWDEYITRHKIVIDNLMEFEKEFIHNVPPQNAKNVMFEINNLLYNELERLIYVSAHFDTSSDNLPIKVMQANARDNRFLFPKISCIYIPNPDYVEIFDASLQFYSGITPPLYKRIMSIEDFSQPSKRNCYTVLYLTPIDFLTRLLVICAKNSSGAVSIFSKFCPKMGDIFILFDEYMQYAIKAEIMTAEYSNYIFDYIFRELKKREYLNSISGEESEEISGLLSTSSPNPNNKSTLLLSLNNLSKHCDNPQIKKHLDSFIIRVLKTNSDLNQ